MENRLKENKAELSLMTEDVLLAFETVGLREVATEEARKNAAKVRDPFLETRGLFVFSFHLSAGAACRALRR